MRIVIESIFINTNDSSMWIGIPKPHLRRFRLAASTFSLLKEVPF